MSDGKHGLPFLSDKNFSEILIFRGNFLKISISLDNFFHGVEIEEQKNNFWYAAQLSESFPYVPLKTSLEDGKSTKKFLKKKSHNFVFSYPTKMVNHSFDRSKTGKAHDSDT